MINLLSFFVHLFIVLQVALLLRFACVHVWIISIVSLLSFLFPSLPWQCFDHSFELVFEVHS